MTGKRPRLMRRTVSVASLGAGSEVVDHQHHHFHHNQAAVESLPLPLPHQVIGFNPKFLTADIQQVEKIAVSPRSNNINNTNTNNTNTKPASGLESLLVDPRAHRDEKEKVGLGILAALGNFPQDLLKNRNRNGFQPQNRHQDKVQRVGSDAHRIESGNWQRELRSLSFLEACYFCRREIGHGRDIYMYRGDRAFCSVECRHQQIVNDERTEKREKCSSAAMKLGKQQSGRHVNNRSAAAAPNSTGGTAAAA